MRRYVSMVLVAVIAFLLLTSCKETYDVAVMPLAYISLYGEIFVFDSNGVIVEYTGEALAALVEIIGVIPINTDGDTFLRVESGMDAQLQYMKDILAAMEMEGIIETVTYLDMTNISHIHFGYGERFKVILGSPRNLRQKFSLLPKGISTINEQLGEDYKGSIDLSSPDDGLRFMTNQPPTPNDFLHSEMTYILRDLWERIDGSTATMPLTSALHEFFGGGGSPPMHNTTPEAYHSMVHGWPRAVDLIFVTYPSEGMFEMAEWHGIEFEIIPIVKDALVFLVNSENSVENITLDELRDIYAGEITKWNTLGGIDGEIAAYQRPMYSGSQTLMLKLLMDGVIPMTPPHEWIAGGMDDLIKSVSAFDNAHNALGYSMFYFVNNMFGNSQFRLLSVDGVRPTRDAIMRSEYPLTTHYYAVIRKDTPENHPARELIKWLLSDEGQALAVRAGYIPLRTIDGAWADDEIDPIFLGDTENSSGSGGTVLKTDISSAEHTGGVRPPLSDMFFDGFNYIQYINNEIIRQLNDVEHPHDGPSYSLGDYQMRPFTGIPNHYPHYAIYNLGSLIIYFPDGNPFLSGSRRVLIPLYNDISPFGIAPPEFIVSEKFIGDIVPRILLFTVSVSFQDEPDVSARINERIGNWAEALRNDEDSFGLLNSFLHGQPDWTFYLRPTVMLWQDYLTISYTLQNVFHDSPGVQMPMIDTITFDINTGAVVNLIEMLPENLEFSNATFFTLADFSEIQEWGDPSQVRMPQGYVPARGFMVTGAWFINGVLNLYITEPNGRILQMYFQDFFD